MQVVKELEAVDVPSLLHPTRRIVILKRGDGLFTFAEQYAADAGDGAGTTAGAWCTLPTEGIQASADLAKAGWPSRSATACPTEFPAPGGGRCIRHPPRPRNDVGEMESVGQFKQC
ncbi:hypothetical protein VQ02_06035 [Methylobacterium variabile]|uniref:Uncharacterized protein n=1 Tax=Methylobacterium variabile TaxID=298794 RepID=A0A0J6T648_9HYPH|nr:hypothetical protein [Methylobacterium variabile]KMO41302.1 hypothetical protein VQ02_06035 [Methylobacterium variabile]